MGGFVAAHLTAHDPDILAACLISGVDLGAAFGALPKDRAAAVVDDNVGTSDGLHILSGTSPEALAEEAKTHAERLRLADHASQLTTRPLLLITSEDGSVSFRGELRSGQTSTYQKLYQATEIRSRSAATRCTWMVRRQASETFWLM